MLNPTIRIEIKKWIHNDGLHSTFVKFATEMYHKRKEMEDIRESARILQLKRKGKRVLRIIKRPKKDIITASKNPRFQHPMNEVLKCSCIGDSKLMIFAQTLQ